MTTLQELYEAGKLQLTFGRTGNLVAFEHWDCKACNGTGLINDEECEECGGTGELSRKIREDDPRWGDIQQLALDLQLAPDKEDEDEN
jgi:RecJ-like exonuclease